MHLQLHFPIRLLCWLPLATVTNYYKLSGSKMYFLTVVDIRNPKSFSLGITGVNRTGALWRV